MREGIETGELGERSATSGVKDRFEILVVTKLIIERERSVAGHGRHVE